MHSPAPVFILAFILMDGVKYAIEEEDRDGKEYPLTGDSHDFGFDEDGMEVWSVIGPVG